MEIIVERRDVEVVDGASCVCIDICNCSDDFNCGFDGCSSVTYDQATIQIAENKEGAVLPSSLR